MILSKQQFIPTDKVVNKTDESLLNLSRVRDEGLEDLIGKVELHETILEYFPGGLCVFDNSQQMMICNSKLKTIIDHPSELFSNGLPTLEQFIRHNANQGEYGDGDIETHVQARIRLVNQKQTHKYNKVTTGGTIFEVRGRPIKDGGFLCTYTDVTKKQKQFHQMEALLESFPGGITVFDDTGKMLICNETLKQSIKNQHILFQNGMPTIENYVWHQAKSGDYGEGDIEQLVNQRLVSLRKKSFIQCETVNSNDTYTTVTVHQLNNGGFVETHIDNTKARLNKAQMEAILLTYPGGILIYDKSLSVTLYNDQFIKLNNYPTELFNTPNLSLRDLFHCDIQQGDSSSDEPSQLVADRLELAADMQPFEKNLFLSNGTVLEVKGTQTTNGDFLLSYQDITEQLAKEVKDVELVNYCQATGLPNRVLFQDRLSMALAQTERGTAMALLNFEIYDFKRINSIAGQSVEDEVLQVLGERFRATKRDTDTFAHLGGNEFAVVQVGIMDNRGAEILARRIQRCIQEPIEINNHVFELDASIGIALSPENAVLSEDIQLKANTALFHAKEVGSGMIMFFSSCVNRLAL